MVALYFAAFAFSVLLLILTLVATSQYRGNYHVLSTMTTAIVNFGYWQLAMSHNLEEALLANRIAYLDGTFLTLFMFLAVAQFCRIRVPAFMVTAMSIAGFVVLGLAYTGGYSTIYYSNVSIVRRHGVTFLVTQDGPAHILYTCLIVVYVVIDLGVMVYAFRNKNKVSYQYLFPSGYGAVLYCCVCHRKLYHMRNPASSLCLCAEYGAFICAVPQNKSL